MERKINDEWSYRARNAIRKRVETLDPANYASRLSILRWRLQMLYNEWSVSSGDELAVKRKHLMDCIKLAEFEIDAIEERIAKGGGNKSGK